MKMTTDQSINMEVMKIIHDVLVIGNSTYLFITYINLRDQKDEKSVHYRNRIKNEIIVPIIELISIKIRTKAIEDYWSEEKLKEVLEFIPNYLDPSDDYLLKERNKVDIGCPCCKSRLVFVKRDAYETISEHVMCNDNPTIKKNAFGCPNELCEANKIGMLWLENGEGPYGPWGQKIKYIDDNKAPFRTWNRRFNAEREKKITVFKIKWMAIWMNISSKADDNGKRSWNKRITFELGFSKDGMGYTKYISGWRMFIYTMKKYTNEKNREKEILDDIKNNSWHRQEWWRKLPLFIASIIWKKEYNAAMEEAHKK